MDNLTPEQLAALAKDNQGPLAKSIIGIFSMLAVVAVCLRIFTRIRHIGLRLGWEDYVIIASLIAAIISGVFEALQAVHGLGKHLVFVDSESQDIILKYLFWNMIFYNISLSLTKISILLQYRRIFTVPKMRIPIQIAMVLCILWGITTVVTALLTCKPPTKDQATKPKPTKCIDGFTMWYINASVNIFTDLVVALLPVRAIWQLQIAKRPKMALLAILTIGWFVCVVSVLRLHALTIFVGNLHDPTYYSAPVAYWSSIEMCLAIVCASLPALKPLIVKIIPGFSSRGDSNGYTLEGDGHSKSRNTMHGIRSTAKRGDTDNIELVASSSTVYPDKSSDEGILGKNIYVSRHFEQHFDDNSRLSDNESQKDLVDRH